MDGTGRVPEQEEDTVHPYISRALAAERVGDWQRRAELARLTKQARRTRHGITTISAERRPDSGQAHKIDPVPHTRSHELEGADRDRRQPVGAGRG